MNELKMWFRAIIVEREIVWGVVIGFSVYIQFDW